MTETSWMVLTCVLAVMVVALVIWARLAARRHGREVERFQGELAATRAEATRLAAQAGAVGELRSRQAQRDDEFDTLNLSCQAMQTELGALRANVATLDSANV